MTDIVPVHGGPLAPVLVNLATELRMEAERFRQLAAEGQARALEYAAEKIDTAIRESAEATVTLAEASRVGGYSTRQLARLIEQGALENVGRPHRPLIRVADIPKKPRPLPAPPTIGNLGRTPGEIARAFVANHQELGR